MDTKCLTVSVGKAAKILGISRGSAYTLAGNGGLPVLRLGNRLLVPIPALEQMLGTAIEARGGASFGSEGVTDHEAAS
jgi:excisionase family DNA binding protein